MRHVVQACVLPVATYGAEVWYQGPQGKGYKERTEAVEKAMVNGARAAIPAWKTTPKTAILREAGFAPASITLDIMRRRTATRWAFADKGHPVHRRRNASTKLGGTARLITKREPPPFRAFNRLPVPQIRCDREMAKARAMVRPPNTVRIWSDGSKLEDGRTGWGCAVFRGSELLIAGKGTLGKKAETYDTELTGAVKGLQWAMANP